MGAIIGHKIVAVQGDSTGATVLPYPGANAKNKPI